MVMLKHLTRNVKREILAVYKTLNKAEMVGQEVLALVHYQNAF